MALPIRRLPCFLWLLATMLMLGTQARHHDDASRHWRFVSPLQELPMPKGWSSCGQASDQFIVKGVFLTPDPPKRAQFMSVRVVGTLKEALAGGRFNYTVHFGIIPIVRDSLPLCEALELEPKLPQCPLRAGDWDVTHQVELPPEVPFGKYTIKAAAWDQEGRQLFCVQGTTAIGLLRGFASDRDPKDRSMGREAKLLPAMEPRDPAETEEADGNDHGRNRSHHGTTPAKEYPGDRQAIFPHP